MHKIVVAIDSFKGCIDSATAASAVKKGILEIFPACEVVCLPVADGGEGILEVLMKSYQGHSIELKAHDPLMELRKTRYGISGDGTTALIEIANINGLPLVPPDKRNPLYTTSWGTGELIRDALDRGCRNFIIGLGGSATNDAGIGMLQALGFRFFDENGQLPGQGGQIMEKVTRIDSTYAHPALSQAHFTIACDVDNPFYGPQGAAYVYARQKGASDNIIQQLDAGMRSLSKIIFQTTGQDITNVPGAGAAGGMGGCLQAFFHADLIPGIRLVLEALDFDRLITDADLIITGEGKADRQTHRGKVPTGVLEAAKKQNIPVLLLAGSVAPSELPLQTGFSGIFSISPGPGTLEQAMQSDFTKSNLTYTVSQLCLLLRAFLPYSRKLLSQNPNIQF